MKGIINIIVWVLILFTIHPTYTQDSIGVEDLRQFAYSFDIENDILTGEGAAVLTKAISDAYVVMLGSQSRSQLESDLDYTLGSVLNQNGYNTLIMEIGPTSAGVINRLTNQQEDIAQSIKGLNQKYGFGAGELKLTPIPDLKHQGAARFVQDIKEKGWSIGAIGAEYWTAYQMIIDELYQNLPVAHQHTHREDYQASRDLLDRLYAEIQSQSYDDVLDLTSALKASDEFNHFLNAMDSFDKNKDMVKSLRYSIDYWWMYGNREFFNKNKLNAQYNKGLMKKALDKMDFDFNDGKLLLKMWRGHLSKGVTPNGFYGVGNMLMELAEYHGHGSLNIGILRRYTTQNGAVIDIMDNPEQVQIQHQPFVSLGEKDNWVLIDLRPFIETFYWGNYIQTLDMHNMMMSYDMIIIPKTDRKAKPNY